LKTLQLGISNLFADDEGYDL